MSGVDWNLPERLRTEDQGADLADELRTEATHLREGAQGEDPEIYDRAGMLDEAAAVVEWAGDQVAARSLREVPGNSGKLNQIAMRIAGTLGVPGREAADVGAARLATADLLDALAEMAGSGNSGGVEEEADWTPCSPREHQWDEGDEGAVYCGKCGGYRCSTCHGSGAFDLRRCYRCNGTGVERPEQIETLPVGEGLQNAAASLGLSQLRSPQPRLSDEDRERLEEVAAELGRLSPPHARRRYELAAFLRKLASQHSGEEGPQFTRTELWELRAFALQAGAESMPETSSARQAVEKLNVLLDSSQPQQPDEEGPCAALEDRP